MNIKQSTLGIISTSICIVTVFVICTLFTVDVFNTWVGYVLVASIPGQITLALVWECNYPAFLTKLKQPLRGIALTVLMALIGAVTVAITLPLIGGSITPPTPMLIQFTILSVLISMWTVVAWQCWPMSALSENPAIVGIGTLLLTYILTYVFFTTLFDYSFMADAPFYTKALDPNGLLNAWTAITYILTTVAVIDALILLDFWPLSSLQEKYKPLQAQPAAGLLNSLFILTVAYAIWYLFIKVLGFEIVDYMVRVVVAFVFGEFIMLVMMQTAPFTNMKQPYKGACLLLCCAALGVAMYHLYAYASLYLIGEVASGPPTYDLDLWLATAMLGLTFPLLIIFADFFQYWPLNKSNDED